MVNYYLFRALTFAPVIMADQLRRMGPEKWDVRPDPDRFSPREVIAHLADWDPIFQGRLETAIHDPGASVIGLDEGEVAIKNEYFKQDVDANIQRFVAARAELVSFLQGLTDAQWNAHFHHSELGRVTVFEYATTIACHDVYHMEQMLHV